MRATLSLLVLLLSPLATPDARCCPRSHRPRSREYARSAAVFVGRVVQQEWRIQLPESCQPSEELGKWNMRSDPEVPGFGAAPTLRVTFQVERAWKGVSSPYLTVGNDTEDCQYVFAMGTEYLVYACATDDGLATSYCTRNAPTHPWPQDEQTAAEDEASFGTPAYDPVTRYEAARARYVRTCLPARTPEGTALDADQEQ